MAFHVPNAYRIKNHARLGSTDAIGNHGAFKIPFESYELFAIASDGEGWEHVSISLENRCPSWKEMCFIKSLFWDDEDCVVQFHPPRSQYVNNHPFCLHLWRQSGKTFTLPPSILVGIPPRSSSGKSALRFYFGAIESANGRRYFALGLKSGYWPCLKAPFVQIFLGWWKVDLWYGLESYKQKSKSSPAGD